MLIKIIIFLSYLSHFIDGVLYFSAYAGLETLNGLEGIVKSSVEKYEVQNNARLNSTEKCTTFACRITEAFTFHESWHDYLNLFKSYVEEERQLTERRQQ